jgi:hypothetical protein
MTATLTLQAETFFSGERVPHIDVSESALSGFTDIYHSRRTGGDVQVVTGERNPASLSRKRIYPHGPYSDLYGHVDRPRSNARVPSRRDLPDCRRRCDAQRPPASRWPRHD